ncbi:uncharacterized protein LOC110704367 [Chenopodium quinoa]|uniref:uncharacterized protein LOC110704367 n=1 Tax=Chenopodium quinoa TaxID=63459 RepID=UPI000B76E7E7|nr:uncharacterized protein LOC110704367 [Chenopodium quinoa]
MSQHFPMSQGDGSFPSFDCSYTSNATDDNNEAKVEDVEENERGHEGGNPDGKTKFLSKAEEVVLVKAWLELFRQRFCMNKHIFLQIKQTLEERHPFFQQSQYATGRFGVSALQKYTVVMRLIAYGTSADYVDDYIRISASLARDLL